MIQAYQPGIDAATSLLTDLARRLGVESAWSVARDGILSWAAGPFHTRFTVEPTSVHTPGIGRLSVVTEAALDGDRGLAVTATNDFNALTGLTRWIVQPDSDGGGFTISVTSSFLVTPETAGALVEIVELAVREQIATVTAKVTNGAEDAWHGDAAVVTFDGKMRPVETWNPVVYHFDEALTPFGEDTAEPWLADVAAVWADLRTEMERSGLCWLGAFEGGILQVETPLRFGQWPGGYVTGTDPAARMHRPGRPGRYAPPATALVTVAAERSPTFGNGLLVLLRHPFEYDDPDRATLDAACLNLLSVIRPDAGHLLGAWTGQGSDLYWSVFLPASFQRVLDAGARRFLLREVLLAGCREGLLGQAYFDGHGAEDFPVGFEEHDISQGPAYAGGAGAVDLPLGVLAQLHGDLVGADIAWSVEEPDRFTWWPYTQPQTVQVAALGPDGDPPHPLALTVSTRVRERVASTTGTLVALARRNAKLSRARLALSGDDGAIDLVTNVFLHSASAGWALPWARDLAAEQVVLADRLTGVVDALGGWPPRPHPVSGPRTGRDDIFAVLPVIRDHAERGGPYTAASMAVSLAGLLAPPVGIGRAEPGAGADSGVGAGPGPLLEFRWLPSGALVVGDGETLTVDPVVATTMTAEVDPDVGPGVAVRTIMPLAGSTAAKAEWCNRMNLDLFTDAPDFGACGGFGLDDGDRVVLTEWVSARLPAHGVNERARALAVVARYQQRAVIRALARDPGLVDPSRVGLDELDQLLATLPAGLARVLDRPAGVQVSAIAESTAPDAAGGSGPAGGRAPAGFVVRAERPLDPADAARARARPGLGAVLAERDQHVLALAVEGPTPGYRHLALLWSWLLAAGPDPGADGPGAVQWPADATFVVEEALGELVRSGLLAAPVERDAPAPAAVGSPEVVALSTETLVGPAGTTVRVAPSSAGDPVLVVTAPAGRLGSALVAQPDEAGTILRVPLTSAPGLWGATGSLVAPTAALVEQALRQATG